MSLLDLSIALSTTSLNKDERERSKREATNLLGKEPASFETKIEKKLRHNSLRIMYFTTLLQSFGASIVITGMWPYLLSLDESAQKTWFGWVVAANPLGQLIFSPLIGWWCNKKNETRLASIFCLVIFIFSNFWYSLLPLHSGGRKWIILIVRFLIGASSGSITACRTYATQGTLLKERTAAISHLSLAQAVGFVLGPVGQLAVQPFGEEGFAVLNYYTINMYTAVGWLTGILGIINIILFHPYFFHESDIANREAMASAKVSSQEQINWNDVKPDYYALVGIIYAFFIIFFNFVLLETLGTPVSIDQFGWSYETAIRNVGLTMIISSVVSTSIFFIIPALSKRFDERILFIFVGIGGYTVGRFFFFPFSGNPAPERTFGCLSPKHLDFNGTYTTSEKDCFQLGGKWDIVQHGCPSTQTWCFEIPALSPLVVAIGYAICTLGFPFCLTLCQTIFSKVIGPRPQGVWMGVLTSISGLSRVVGPIFVTFVYTRTGTIVTNSIATALLISSFVYLLVIYRRLVPLVYVKK